MKALGKLLIFLIGLALLLGLIGFLLPKSQHVERSLQIDAPAAAIMPYVTDFKKFNEWSPWAKIDPDGTTYAYSGAETGVGSKVSWESDHKDVGSGTQEIKAITDNRVDLHLDFGSQGEADAYYLLEPNANGTKVTWGFDTDAGNNPIQRWFGLMLDKWVGNAYAEGLQNLNGVVKKNMKKEAASNVAAKKKAEIDIKAVTYDPSKAMELKEVEVESQTIVYAFAETTLNTEAISTAMETGFNSVSTLLQKKQIKPIGVPMAINDLVDFKNNNYRFKTALPVDEKSIAGKSLGDSVLIEPSYAGNAIQLKHVGSHKDLPNSYAQIEAYMKEKGYSGNGWSWEEYITDNKNTPADKQIIMIYNPFNKDDNRQ